MFSVDIYCYDFSSNWLVSFLFVFVAEQWTWIMATNIICFNCINHSVFDFYVCFLGALNNNEKVLPNWWGVPYGSSRALKSKGKFYIWKEMIWFLLNYTQYNFMSILIFLFMGQYVFFALFIIVAIFQYLFISQSKIPLSSLTYPLPFIYT